MKRSLILGGAGALLLLVGVFVPVVKAPFVGSVNLINNGKGIPGLILAAAAVISIIVVAARIDERSLWVTGMIALGVVAYSLTRIVVGISQLNDAFAKGFDDNPFKGLGELALDSIQLQWGWVPLFVGAIAILAAPRLTESMTSLKLGGLALIAVILGAVIGVVLANTNKPAASSPLTGPGFSQNDQEATEAQAENAEKFLEVETSSITYRPESGETGEHYHEVFVLVKNTSDKVALDVSAQISISKDGRLLKTLDPSYLNVLPDGRALMAETSVELTEPAPDSEIKVQFTAARFRPGSKNSPVSFKEVKFSKGEYDDCEIRGVMSNTFSKPRGDVEVVVAGFEGSKIVTGGFTYVTALPNTDATFDINSYRCPDKVDRVEVFPDLNEDQIFRP